MHPFSLKRKNSPFDSCSFSELRIDITFTEQKKTTFFLSIAEIETSKVVKKVLGYYLRCSLSVTPLEKDFILWRGCNLFLDTYATLLQNYFYKCSSYFSHKIQKIVLFEV